MTATATRPSLAELRRFSAEARRLIPFRIGRGVLLRDGGDVGLLGTGVQTGRVLEAADLLAAEGIAAGVLSLPTLKPLDADAIVALADRTGAIVTAEDHSIIDGLGGAVAETIGERRPTPHPPRRLARRLRRVRPQRCPPREVWPDPAPRRRRRAEAAGVAAETVVPRLGKAAILPEKASSWEGRPAGRP